MIEEINWSVEIICFTKGRHSSQQIVKSQSNDAALNVSKATIFLGVSFLHDGDPNLVFVSATGKLELTFLHRDVIINNDVVLYPIVEESNAESSALFPLVLVSDKDEAASDVLITEQSEG